MWTASQVGWFDEANFVLPDTTIGKDEDSILFQTESNNHQEYSTAGTLKDWRGGVGAVIPLCYLRSPLRLLARCSNRAIWMVQGFIFSMTVHAAKAR
jgi:hypothetical protein